MITFTIIKFYLHSNDKNAFFISLRISFDDDYNGEEFQKGFQVQKNLKGQMFFENLLK